VLVTVLPPVLGTLNEKFIAVPEVEFTVSDGPPGVDVKVVEEVELDDGDWPLAFTPFTLKLKLF
jgi:hypothetical protein